MEESCEGTNDDGKLNASLHGFSTSEDWWFDTSITL